MVMNLNDDSMSNLPRTLQREEEEEEEAQAEPQPQMQPQPMQIATCFGLATAAACINHMSPAPVKPKTWTEIEMNNEQCSKTCLIYFYTRGWTT